MWIKFNAPNTLKTKKPKRNFKRPPQIPIQATLMCVKMLSRNQSIFLVLNPLIVVGFVSGLVCLLGLCFGFFFPIQAFALMSASEKYLHLKKMLQ